MPLSILTPGLVLSSCFFSWLRQGIKQIILDHMGDTEGVKAIPVLSIQAKVVDRFDKVDPSKGRETGETIDASFLVFQGIEGTDRLDLVIGIGPEFDRKFENDGAFRKVFYLPIDCGGCGVYRMSLQGKTAFPKKKKNKRDGEKKFGLG